MVAVHMPVVTTLAAGVLGLVFVALSALVVVQRTRGQVMLGAGAESHTPMFVAFRSHANFAEYVPLGLVLIGLVELQSGSTLVVKLLAGGLVVGRIIHPIGMRIAGANPFRAGGFILSVLVLAGASVAALIATLR